MSITPHAINSYTSTEPKVNEGEFRIKLTDKLLVAASAGIIGSLITYPLDIIKTSMQVNTSKFTIEGLVSTVKQVSQRGFYRGFSAVLVGIAPEKSLKLTTNDLLRDHYSNYNKKKLKVSEEIISGSVAGFCQLFVTVPYELIKIQLQMNKGSNLGFLDVVKKEGLFGIYRGFVPTFYRDVPFCFVFFPLYSQIKSFQMNTFYKDHLKYNKHEPDHVGLTSGLIAGSVAGGLVTPADMIKTRIQRGLIETGQNSLSLAKSIIKSEGFASLFKGWYARVAVIGPLYGFVSLAFEFQKKILMERAKRT